MTGSSTLELSSLLSATVTRKGIGRRRRRFFWLDESWASHQYDVISRENKLTLLLRKVRNRKLWRNGVEALHFMEWTFKPKAGASWRWWIQSLLRYLDYNLQKYLNPTISKSIIHKKISHYLWDLQWILSF